MYFRFALLSHRSTRWDGQAAREIQGSLRSGGKCAASGQDDVQFGLAKKPHRPR